MGRKKPWFYTFRMSMSPVLVKNETYLLSMEKMEGTEKYANNPNYSYGYPVNMDTVAILKYSLQKNYEDMYQTP